MWTTILTGFLAGPAMAAPIVIAFDKADDLAGWQNEYEAWLIQDGTLTQSQALSAGKRAVLWRPSQRFGDLDLSVEFRINADNPGVSSAGLIYRADSPTDYYWARLDPRPGKQAATFYRARDGKETNLLKSVAAPGLESSTLSTVFRSVVIARNEVTKQSHPVELHGIASLRSQ